MAATHPITLTQLESIYLSDALSMFMQGPPDAPPGQGAPYPVLLLKIGGAVLETEQKKAPVTVQLSLYELWTVREVAKSSVVIGSERVGLSLLLKIYEGIRALSAASDMESLVNALGEVADDEPGKNEYAAQLERLKNSVDTSPGGGSDEDKSKRRNDKPSNPNKD
jgi:hypothetical protein